MRLNGATGSETARLETTRAERVREGLSVGHGYHILTIQTTTHLVYQGILPRTASDVVGVRV